MMDFSMRMKRSCEASSGMSHYSGTQIAHVVYKLSLRRLGSLKDVLKTAYRRRVLSGNLRRIEAREPSRDRHRGI